MSSCLDGSSSSSSRHHQQQGTHAHSDYHNNRYTVHKPAVMLTSIPEQPPPPPTPPPPPPTTHQHSSTSSSLPSSSPSTSLSSSSSPSLPGGSNSNSNTNSNSNRPPVNAMSCMGLKRGATTTVATTTTTTTTTPNATTTTIITTAPAATTATSTSNITTTSASVITTTASSAGKNSYSYNSRIPSTSSVNTNSGWSSSASTITTTTSSATSIRTSCTMTPTPSHVPPARPSTPSTPTLTSLSHTPPTPSPLTVASTSGPGGGPDEEPRPPAVVVTGVRAATPERLIQMCVESFSPTGIDEKQIEFVDVFFLMHQWFMTSEELAQAFIDLYQGCDETLTCTLVTCQHLPMNTDCTIQAYKKMICQCVKHWIKKYPLHFDNETKVTNAVHRLRNLLQAEGNFKLKEMVDVSKVPSYDWMRSMSVRNTTWGKHSRKVSLVFNHLEPKELAAQLTYLEYKAFRRINFCDYKNYAVSASLKDQPKLERSISLFNGLSQWVQCMVLSKTTPQQRANVICKFIDVSKHLRDLQNFNTLMAIVGGLSHSALARLSKTLSCLPPESQKTLLELSELLSSNNNFSNYRKVYHQCSGPKVPILGVHLKDLISLHVALPDRVDGNLLNFRKMTQLGVILRELTRLQHQETIPVDANMDLVNTLRLSLDLYHTEDEIYELSLAREPRGSLSSPTTPTKPVVFADWLSGIKPPDSETINKHVHDMVEAVFKNYDHDKDGFISHEEFESITGNFPFIDSFCVLDADKDGMISKKEMKIYFIRANSHALRNSFKHAFTETTYFKPTYCIHCTGLLWGIIKQGWKCKECGINAHKHCKDLVVMECRSKGSKRSEHLTNGVAMNDLTITAKRKMSQRQQKRVSPSHTCQQATQTDTLLVCRSSSLRNTSTSSTSTINSIISTASTANSSDVHSDVGESPGNPASRLEHQQQQNPQHPHPHSHPHHHHHPPLPPPPPPPPHHHHHHQHHHPRHPPHHHHRRDLSLIDGEYYEEQALLYERLLKSEEAREKLIEENSRLRSKLDVANDQINLLKSHIGVIRQNTIAFILEQMDALHMQRDTEV